MSDARLPLVVPLPLLDFSCNLRGCCCGGWAIPVSRTDLARIHRLRPTLTDDDLCVRAQVGGVEPEPGEELARFLRQVETPAGRRCLFLTADHHCQLQREGGAAALPDVCALFPVRVFLVGERLELRYSAACPAVLAALGPGDAPLVEALLARPTRLGHTFRLALVRELDEVRIGPTVLDVPTALQLRELLLHVVGRPGASVGRRLAEAASLLDLVATGEAAEVDLEALSVDESGFARRLARLADELPAARLCQELLAYRPFLDDPSLLAVLDHPEPLRSALDAWPDHYAARWLPAAAALDPVCGRVLWLWCHDLFLTDAAGGRVDGDRLVGLFARVLRVAAARAGVLQRPGAGPVLTAALGLSSFIDSHYQPAAAGPAEGAGREPLPF